MDEKIPHEIVAFYGRGFKCYRWVDEDGRTCSPYFSTQEKAQEWKDKQNETD